MKTGILLIGSSLLLMGSCLMGTCLIGSWMGAGDLPLQRDYILSGNYAVTIHGKFSIHNWSEAVQNVTGSLTATVNADGTAGIKTIRMVMKTRSIKSDMGSVMDNKTYKALKGDAGGSGYHDKF